MAAASSWLAAVERVRREEKLPLTFGLLNKSTIGRNAFLVGRPRWDGRVVSNTTIGRGERHVSAARST